MVPSYWEYFKIQYWYFFWSCSTRVNMLIHDFWRNLIRDQSSRLNSPYYSLMTGAFGVWEALSCTKEALYINTYCGDWQPSVGKICCNSSYFDFIIHHERIYMCGFTSISLSFVKRLVNQYAHLSSSSLINAWSYRVDIRFPSLIWLIIDHCASFRKKKKHKYHFLDISNTPCTN